MKHIDIRYHQIREIVEEGKVELVKFHTKENPVDALMKILPQDSFRRCVTLMYLMDRMELAEVLGHQCALIPYVRAIAPNQLFKRQIPIGRQSLLAFIH